MQTKILAVTGNPVLHSLSPVLMNGAINDKNLNFRYLRLPAESAEEAMDVFKKLNLSGMNVTAPFKTDVIKFLDYLTPNALKANAVNCVYRIDNKIAGDNSDILGVELSIKNNISIEDNKEMLVIGSGGAVPAVIIAGQNLGLNVTVTARNQLALNNLQSKFNVETKDIKNINNFVNDYSIIVQALPSGVKIFDPEILTPNHLILDANYKDSIFEKPAQKIGYKFLSGKNWLVNQAVPAFKLFTNVETNAEIMYQALGKNNFKYNKKIALTGFMGVGKTTSGKKLAKLLNYKFVDLDDEIENAENMKISEIFSSKGEDYFRNIEQKMLNNFSESENIILSCGGGTVKNAENRKILREKFLNIWLYASAAWCIDGLDVSNRPLLQCANPLEVAEKMLAERIDYYADAAFAIVNVEKLNSDNIAKKIYEQINKTFGV